MKAPSPLRKLVPREDASLDREIDSAIQHFMKHSPPPGALDAVMERIRERPRSSSDLQTSFVFGFGVVAAAVFFIIAASLLVRNQVHAAVPGSSVPLLAWIGNSDLALWINESESIFGYPGILFLHTLGLAMVVGLSVSTGVRLLGVGSQIPVTSLSRLFPYMWAGFWVNAISGVLLFIADPVHKALNPLFEVKLALIALGIAVLTLIQRQLQRIALTPEVEEQEQLKSKFLAIASLTIWLAAITAGRLLAYIKGS